MNVRIPSNQNQNYAKICNNCIACRAHAMLASISDATLTHVTHRTLIKA